MKNKRFSAATRICAALAMLPWSLSAARAEIVLSQVIVDLQPGKPSHDDIEVWNNGPERIYVVAEPSEIKSPGLSGEQRITNPDPAVTGLLVTPQRLVLEPDQRRVIRVSAISPRAEADRIYRVMVKPVAGAVSSDTTALKVLIGYDVLVIYRPEKIMGDVTATHAARKLAIRNGSNTAQELFSGQQCDKSGKNCKNLKATRLYAGATLEQDLDYDTPIEYQVTRGSGTVSKHF